MTVWTNESVNGNSFSPTRTCVAVAAAADLTTRKQNTMKTGTVPRLRISAATTTMTLALGLLCASVTGSLRAQTPCPQVKTFATGLLAPSKMIQTPHGNFIVAEVGPEVPNNGRVSIVDRHGKRRTLLDGLPSARTFVGDFNGTTGVYLEGSSLFSVEPQNWGKRSLPATK